MCGRIRVLGIKEYSKMQSHHLFFIWTHFILYPALESLHDNTSTLQGQVRYCSPHWRALLVERLLPLLSSSAHLSKPHQHVLYLETLTQTWDWWWEPINMIFPHFLRNFENLWVSLTWGSLFSKGSEHFPAGTVRTAAVSICQRKLGYFSTSSSVCVSPLQQ